MQHNMLAMISMSLDKLFEKRSLAEQTIIMTMLDRAKQDYPLEYCTCAELLYNKQDKRFRKRKNNK